MKGGIIMKIYVLEESNYDGNDLLLVSEDKGKILPKINEVTKMANGLPYYYVSIWENGECLKTYTGKDVADFMSN